MLAGISGKNVSNPEKRKYSEKKAGHLKKIGKSGKTSILCNIKNGTFEQIGCSRNVQKNMNSPEKLEKR